jgi:hypothetical protein
MGNVTIGPMWTKKFVLKNIFDWPRQNHYNINITLISSKEKKRKKKTYFPESKKI